ncbi:MAG TPA: hypothetical protein VHI77_08860 [Solirubrobacterales bacterium]|jgi:hypothetical protein|nr:hypothetical protein [Solirubrobacterales bacterium]
MSILDDAIREHLELKRAHGADESELKKLEDEAFGPPQRPDAPDPFAEAPTEFLGAPEGVPEGGTAPGAGTAVAEPAGRRMPNIADLQEPPPFPPPEAPEAEAEAPPEESAPAPQAEAPAAPEPPAVEEQPAVEQPLPEPADAGPSTEERQAISEQPTEFFDVEAEMDESAPPAAEPTPSDDELADAEASEPRLAAAPPPEPEVADEAPSEEYEEDDFFSEQRLSDELDQALEAPVTDEQGSPLPSPSQEEEPSEEYEEPISEEYEEGEHETGEEEQPPASLEPGHEDVLEDTPDFLEDGEDDDLWFEQRPPKDFDFDD